MIGGTTSPLAIQAGLEVLRQGGSAADAAIATSLAQIVLSAGAWNSFAGVLHIVYFDATSGKVHALNAGYNTVEAETESLTIPRQPDPSGRTVLVPGFMAGIEVVHRKFGRLPFASLFQPAIYFAEEGFEIDGILSGMIAYRQSVLSRLPEARAIFYKPDGEIYRKGDIFRQPQLASTLWHVASSGAGYMYSGDWARNCVDAVNREGGRVSLDDLNKYKTEWVDAVSTGYGENEVFTLGYPNIGGVQLLEALNLLDEAQVRRRGHHTDSAESLYWSIKITRFSNLVSLLRPTEKSGADDRFAPVNRVRREFAKENWDFIQKPNWESELFRAAAPAANHSDSVVVADEQRNVAVLVHSINTTVWGTTGMFVDGVSIPDSASFQQQRILQVGLGARVPTSINPVIVLRNGKPTLAAGAIGSSLHESMVQNLVNILDFEMDPRTAVDTPNFLGPAWSSSSPDDASMQAVGEGDFAEALLGQVREMGQPIKEMGAAEKSSRASHWVGLQISPNDRSLKGAVSAKLNGIVEGY